MQSILKSAVMKRSVVLAGHKTSVSLEEEFWVCLKEIAGSREMLISELVAEIDKTRQQGNLSSALRLFVLAHYSIPIKLFSEPESSSEL